MDEVQAGEPALAGVCRSAMAAIDASRLVIWRRRAGADVLTPYLEVAAGAPAAVGRAVAERVGPLPVGWMPHGTGARPFVVRDLPGLRSGTGAAVWCQVIPGTGAAGEDLPAGVIAVQPAAARADAGVDGSGAAGLTVLAAAVGAWWRAGGAAQLARRAMLLRDLSDAGRDLDAEGLVRLGCRLLASAVGARRASVFVEEDPGAVRLRRAVLCDGADDRSAWSTAVAVDRCPTVVAGVLASGRPDITTYGPGSDVAVDGLERNVGVTSVVAVPFGERAVLVVEGDGPDSLGPDELELSTAVSAHLREAAVAQRRKRETKESETTAAALRQLLEAGVRACSSIEAAEALAATAIKVTGLPTACAYLVDADGVISEVATVGASPERAHAVRSSLVGKAAAGSPVWRRTVEGADAGPDLIADTAVAGLVRPGGVAESLGLRSLATIPLLSSDGPLGLVLCGSPEPRRRWRASDRHMLAQLALEGTVVVDNARLREAERHEANHDPLTGLLNRRAFTDRFEQALVAARTGARPLAVLVLDLDRFKEVNDHLGHHSGDELLVEVSRRLRSSCRQQDLLARLGGDEFAVVLGGDAGAAYAMDAARRIRAALDHPVVLGESTLSIECSIGIALAPAHGEDVADLLCRADLAMYTAKRAGHGTRVFEPEMRAPTGGAGLLGDLRSALRRGDELVLRYQPKFDLRSGRVTGVEALVRWDHPVHGVLGPDLFVPLAEESGLIGALTSWVVPTALRQLAVWRAAGHELRLAVNVSATDVANPELSSSVRRWLAEAGVPGSCLIVEVTEGALLQDRDRTTAVLGDLRSIGVEVSLDDFGTGYSSLAYLNALAIDEIKADRQFLRSEAGDGSVLRSIIALGHEIGVRVVAEGVETADHLAWLVAAGCDEAQGYHLGRPAEAEVVDHLLEQAPRPAFALG